VFAIKRAPRRVQRARKLSVCPSWSWLLPGGISARGRHVRPSFSPSRNSHPSIVSPSTSMGVAAAAVMVVVLVPVCLRSITSPVHETTPFSSRLMDVACIVCLVVAGCFRKRENVSLYPSLSLSLSLSSARPDNEPLLSAARRVRNRGEWNFTVAGMSSDFHLAP